MAGGSVLRRAGVLGAEEALHALFLEAAHPAVERALRGAGLARPLRHGASEQHQRRYLLVGALRRPPAQQRELLPFVGRLDAPTARRPAHIRFPPHSAVPRPPLLATLRVRKRATLAAAVASSRGAGSDHLPTGVSSANPIPSLGRRVCSEIRRERPPAGGGLPEVVHITYNAKPILRGRERNLG